jgi:hypothetical protein
VYRLGKILLKILNLFKKLKKRKKKEYSLIPLLRTYEELMKMEQEADKKRNVRYVYIHEPRDYPFDTTPRAEWKEKSIWDIDLPIIINNKL